MWGTLSTRWFFFKGKLGFKNDKGASRHERTVFCCIRRNDLCTEDRQDGMNGYNEAEQE